MTRANRDGQAAHLAALAASSGLPERLSWPAAAAVILTVSLALWLLIGIGIAALIG